jgi:hypothetical protein
MITAILAGGMIVRVPLQRLLLQLYLPRHQRKPGLQITDTRGETMRRLSFYSARNLHIF